MEDKERERGRGKKNNRLLTHLHITPYAFSWTRDGGTGWTVINSRVERHPWLATLQFITRFGFAPTIRGGIRSSRQKGMKKASPPLWHTRGEENSGIELYNYVKKRNGERGGMICKILLRNNFTCIARYKLRDTIT